MKEVAFINRENELMSLGKVYFEADQGRGRFVFIAGQDGIGKTSLIHKFRDNSGEGSLYLEYMAEEGVREPYESFKKMLQSYPDQMVVGKALSYLGAGKDSEDSAPAKKEILFNELATTFSNMASEKVLIVFVNRMHLLDKDSRAAWNHGV